MDTPIIAVHLVYAQGMFPAHEKWEHGEKIQVPELLEEIYCENCIRAVWYLTPEEGDADLVKAARHMCKVVHLTERIDLLEQDMVEQGERCDRCGRPLYITSLSDDQQISTKTETDFVWDPNTQTSNKFTITRIVRAPDTFCYGEINDNGRMIRVYFSPSTHSWSR